MVPDLSINQVKAILLSMAEDDSVTPLLIQTFFEKFLVRKPLLILSFNYPFLARCSPNDYSVNAKSTDAVFKNVSRCSYNPNNNSIKLQRCNYEKQQVFYGSVPAKAKQVSADMTALLEVSLDYVKNKNINRWYFTLSRWKVNRPLNMVVLPFSKRSHSRNEDFKAMNKEFNRILKQSTEGDKELYFYFKDFLEFISNVFCKRGKKNCYYKISSAYFNAMLEIIEKQRLTFINYKPTGKYIIDGIIYPSANTKAEGMNVCLRKELVDDSSIKCDMAVMSAMQRDASNFKHITFPNVSNESIPDENGDLHFNRIW